MNDDIKRHIETCDEEFKDCVVKQNENYPFKFLEEGGEE